MAILLYLLVSLSIICMNNYYEDLLGFEFGGLLALSVYASVWKQTCLSISNLSQSTMCVTFGVPLVPLKAVEDKIVDECLTEMKQNSHIFQLHGDFVSRLLRFDDITNGVKDHDKVSQLLCIT